MKEKYFHIHPESIFLGLLTSFFGCLFLYFQIFLHFSNNYFIISCFSIFVFGLLNSFIFYSSLLTKVKYNLGFLFFSTMSFALGGFLYHSYLYSCIALIIYMGIASYSVIKNNHFFTVMLLVGNLYVIGTGFPIHSFEEIYYHSFYYFLGGFFVFLFYFIRYVFFSHFKKKKENNGAFFILKNKYTKKVAILYSFQMIFVVLISYSISFWFKLPDGYWLPMTSLLILKIEKNMSFEKIRHRFFGTVLGSFVALPFLFLNDKHLLIAFLFPIFFLTIISSAKHYGVYVVFLTAMVSILMSITSSISHFETLLYRNLNTTLSVLIVGICIFIFSLFSKKVLEK